MATLKYLSQYFSTTLNVGGGIDASQTTGIILQSVSGVHDITEPGQICITYSDPIDTAVAEWIDYTSINGSNELVGAVRGREGFSAHAHLQGATVAFVLSASHHNDVVDAVKKVYNETTDTLLKATAAEVATGTDDAKIVTPLSAAPYGNSSLSRQAIINGNFDVWQRGTTYTGIATGSFLADRFSLSHSADSGTFPTHINRRTAITSGSIPNAYYSYELNVNGAGTSLGAGSYYWIRQKIENGVRYLCGDGKKVTLSFWAKSDIANKRLGVHIRQDYGTSGSPSTAEVINGTNWTLTSTWTKYTHTFTTNTLTAKTFGTDNNDAIDLQFMYVWAATYKDRAGATTDESFVGAGSIFIAQVQLCAGDVALPFQPKSFEEELRACQRYYEKSYDYATVPGTSTTNGLLYTTCLAQLTGNGGAWPMGSHPRFQVRKRAVPTILLWDNVGNANTWYIGGVNRASSGTFIGETGFSVTNNTGGNITPGADATYGHYTASAEL